MAIISCGVMVGVAISAAETLSSEGISCTVVDMHTIKPLDVELIAKLSDSCGAFVTAEDHSIHVRAHVPRPMARFSRVSWYAPCAPAADDDAEPRVEACEARSKQPGAADSGASIATTDSGAGAGGANGGAANRATADATGGMARGRRGGGDAVESSLGGHGDGGGPDALAYVRVGDGAGGG